MCSVVALRRPCAPRMISHITSSMPSEPASRRYSRCGMPAQLLRVGDQLGRGSALSHSRVDQAGARRPAAGGSCRPCPRSARSEVLMEALDRPLDRLAQIVATVAGGRRILRRRSTANGIDLHRPFARRWPNTSDSGTVRPWSTSISIDDGEVELVEDHRLGDVRRRSPAWPLTTGTGRGPQPSSAGWNSSAQPIAKVGIMSSENADGVVVVDQHDDVGLAVLDPLLGPFDSPSNSGFQ